MNLDYRFPLFDELLHGKLDPMKPGNELNSNYELRLEKQIVVNANDTGIFQLKFMPPLNVKCHYYKRLLLSETFLYCEDVLTYLLEQEDYRIRAYLKDTLLDKHLVTCLKMLGDRIRQDHLQLSHITKTSSEPNIEKVTNVYVFQLLKVCIAKAYLEFQHSLSDVVQIKQTEAMLYSAYNGEVPPVKTFLTQRSKAETAKPPKNYEQAEPVRNPESQFINESGNETKQSMEFYTVKEVCKLMKVGERTVRRKIEKNVITAFLEGGKYLIDKKKLDNYLINKSLTHLNTKMK